MRHSSLILFLALLVLGGGAWLLFERNPSSLTPVTAVVPKGSSGGGAQADSSPPALEADQETAPEERVEVEGRTIDPLGEPGAVATVGSFLTGPGVRGRIVDTQGQPLQGALVVAAGSDPFPLDYAGDSDSGFAQRWRTASGADGRFVLQGPEPGELRLGAWHSGFAPLERTDLVLPSGSGADFGDLVMDEGVVLEGRVVGEGGAGVAGAELVAESTQEGSPFTVFSSGVARRPVAVSAPDGSFRIDTLRAGPWRIAVKSAGYPDKSFEGQTERPGERRSGLELVLDAGAQIQGKVVGIPAGLPTDERSALVVRATPRGMGRSFGPMRSWREAPVAGDGSFVIEGCDKGAEYELTGRLSDGHRGLPWGGEVKARTGVLAAEGGQSGLVLQWTGTTGVHLRVTDAGGRAVEEFSVSFGGGMLRELQQDGEAVTHHPGGEVTLKELPSTGWGGAFKVVVDAPGYKSEVREVELKTGQIVDAGVIALSEAPVLVVRVEELGSGDPIAGARVSLAVRGTSPREVISFRGPQAGQRRSGRTDVQGVVRLSSFPGEVCELVVERAGYTRAVIPALVMPPGEGLEQRVSLGFGGKVEVLVLDASGAPHAGVRVERRKLDDESLTASEPRLLGDPPGVVTDQAGIALFEHLEPGEHGFKLGQSSGGFGMLFRLQENEEAPANPWTTARVVEGGVAQVELHEAPKASLMGHVSEASRALAGARLTLTSRDGDDAMPAMSVAYVGLGGGAGTCTSDGSGAFALEGLEPGAYTLRIRHATRRMAATREVVLGVGTNHLEVELSVAVIEGEIVDDAGEPVVGAKVEASVFGGTGDMLVMPWGPGGSTASPVEGEQGDPSVTDAEGHYLLRGVQVNADLEVRATRDGLAPASNGPVRLAEGELKDGVNLVMLRSGKVHVVVDGLEPGAFGFVKATYQGDESIEPVVEFVGSGEVTLTGLRPGAWSIELQNVGPQGSAGSSPAKAVDIAPGTMGEVHFDA